MPEQQKHRIQIPLSQGLYAALSMCKADEFISAKKCLFPNFAKNLNI